MDAASVVKRVVLTLGLALLTSSGTADATPQFGRLSETEQKLLDLARRLRERKDTEGLVLALNAASELRGGRSSHVKREIIRALADMNPTKAVIDALIREVGSEGAGPSSRAEAAKALGSTGDKRALDALVPVARGRRQNDDIAARAFRLAAVQALSKLGGPRARKALLECLGDLQEHAVVRRGALFSLMGMKLSEADRCAVVLLAANPDEAAAVWKPIIGLPQRTGDLRWVAPLLEVLGRLSALMEGKNEDARRKASQVFLAGLRSLESALHKPVERLGCRLVPRAGAAIFSGKSGKKLLSYERAELLKSPEERKRVLGFWAKWWSDNETRRRSRARRGRRG